MLRNLAAIIVAAIAGLIVAKFAEALIGGGVAPGEAADGGNLAGLVAGYFIGAFIAASIALLIGRRWAPLGWLAAATILFNAIITMTTFKLTLFLWPVSIAACAAGGWLAIRLLKASTSSPQNNRKESLFDN